MAHKAGQMLGTKDQADAVAQTALPLPLYTRGKVRDVYAAGDRLVIIATDRLSAFDHVLPTPIPDRGAVLTQLSAFWFTQTAWLVGHHMISADLSEIGRHVPAVRAADPRLLAGRTMLVRRAERIDVECVVRGYITGSAWEEYRRTGTVAGVPLPAGLRHGDPLPAPLFTPATKAAVGHDVNITFDEMAHRVGAALAGTLRETSVALYRVAAAHARARGLLLADTKFEFGLIDGRVTLIDEALTPDSSRYWDAAAYPRSLASFDKQFVRDYLNGIGWTHEPPAPPLPPDVVEATRRRYLETYRRITGSDLAGRAP